MLFLIQLQSRGELISKSKRYVETTQHTFTADGKKAFYQSQYRDAKSDVLAGKWSLELAIEPTNSPEAHLVVYYVKDNNEVVASSFELKIKSCLKHQVRNNFKLLLQIFSAQ